MSRAHSVMMGKMSNCLPLDSSMALSNFSAQTRLCSLKTSIKLFNIWKWNAGVKSRLLFRHLAPSGGESTFKDVLIIITRMRPPTFLFVWSIFNYLLLKTCNHRAKSSSKNNRSLSSCAAGSPKLANENNKIIKLVVIEIIQVMQPPWAQVLRALLPVACRSKPGKSCRTF